VKPRLSKSVIQLREQVDDTYPNRDRRTDGTIGDAKHDSKSDHTPDAAGWVRAIHNHKIASRILNWKWRKYSGSNPHTSHIHVSFNKGKADTDGSFFEIPMLGSKQ
jgi:hypothetical protein